MQLFYPAAGGAPNQRTLSVFTQQCYAKWQTHFVFPLLIIAQTSRMIPTKVTGIVPHPGGEEKNMEDEE